MLRFLGMCVLLVTVILTKTALGQCDLINEGASAEDLTSFLRSSLDLSDTQRNGACIEFGLRHLEYKPAAQNAEQLVRYLDCRDGDMRGQEDRSSSTHPRCRRPQA